LQILLPQTIHPHLTTLLQTTHDITHYERLPPSYDTLDCVVLVGEALTLREQVVMIRRASDVLVLCLMVETDAISRANGIATLLQCGADDATTTSEDSRLVACRVHAIARRAERHRKQKALPTWNELTLTTDYNLTCGTTVQAVTKQEFNLLEHLFAATGTLPKSTLLSRMYPNETDRPAPKMIDVLVCYVNKKLTALTGGQYRIATEYRMGVRMERMAHN